MCSKAWKFKQIIKCVTNELSVSSIVILESWVILILRETMYSMFVLISYTTVFANCIKNHRELILHRELWPHLEMMILDVIQYYFISRVIPILRATILSSVIFVPKVIFITKHYVLNLAFSQQQKCSLIKSYFVSILLLSSIAWILISRANIMSKIILKSSFFYIHLLLKNSQPFKRALS